LPKKEITTITKDLIEPPKDIDFSEKTTPSTKKSSKEITPSAKEFSEETTPSTKKSSKESINSIDKAIDNWYLNLNEPQKVIPNTDEFDLAKSILKNRLERDIKKTIDTSIEAWVNNPELEIDKNEMQNVKDELGPKIANLILKLQQESKASLNKKAINKIVNSYLNNKLKSKKIINEVLISKNINNSNNSDNNEENLINFKRINQLAGLD
jgi:hypothetical protein